MIKSLVALYSNIMFHVAGAKIIRDIRSGLIAKLRQKLPYWNEKQNLDSGRVQQLSLSVSATGENLVSQIEAGGARS